MQQKGKGGTSKKRVNPEVVQKPTQEKKTRKKIPGMPLPKSNSFEAMKKASKLRKGRQVKERAGIVFAIDTNIFLSKPGVLYGLGEHDIFVPDTVIKELDKFKRSDSNDDEHVRLRAANARATAGLLLRHAESVPSDKLHEGVKLMSLSGVEHKEELGTLYIGGPAYAPSIATPTIYPSFFEEKNPDHKILMECLDWVEREKECGENARKLILISKDKLMRLDAHRAGIPAEDYLDDAIDVENIRSTGVHYLPKSFWERQKNIESQVKPNEEKGRNHYTLLGKELENIAVNEFIIQETSQGSVHLQVLDKPSIHKVRTREVVDYMRLYSVFGVNAKNIEQNFALNVLMDPRIPVVIIEGPAGSGKNFLALAASLQQIADGRYKEIIATRDAVPVGEQTGFKPGDEDGKMQPWMAGVLNNIDVLRERVLKSNGSETLGSKVKRKRKIDARTDFDVGPELKMFLEKDYKKYLTLKEINSMRGSSLESTVLIFDENQNSTRAQQKMLFTRPGRNTKVICLGNFTQTDRLFTDRSSGLARVIDITRGWKLSAHIVLRRVERSDVAAFFEANL